MSAPLKKIKKFKFTLFGDIPREEGPVYSDGHFIVNTLNLYQDVINAFSTVLEGLDNPKKVKLLENFRQFYKYHYAVDRIRCTDLKFEDYRRLELWAEDRLREIQPSSPPSAPEAASIQNDDDTLTEKLLILRLMQDFDLIPTTTPEDRPFHYLLAALTNSTDGTIRATLNDTIGPILNKSIDSRISIKKRLENLSRVETWFREIAARYLTNRHPTKKKLQNILQKIEELREYYVNRLHELK